MTGSPSLNHYAQRHSDRRFAPSSFDRKAGRGQSLTTYGSLGDTADETESQRALAPLSRSNTFVAKVPGRLFQCENDTVPDIEMHGIKRAYKGIHVRHDVNVEFSADQE